MLSAATGREKGYCAISFPLFGGYRCVNGTPRTASPSAAAPCRSLSLPPDLKLVLGTAGEFDFRAGWDT